MGLLQDQVGKSDDICDTYSQYLDSLDHAITSKPSDRSFQHQLDLVQQELVAVKRTLWKQRSLIYRLRKSLTAIDTEDIVMSQIEHEIVLKEAEKQYSNKRHYSETLPPPHSQRQDEDYNRIVPVSYAQEVTTANDYMGLDDDFLFDLASSSKLSPTDAGGLRGLFFLECSRLIEQREFEFRRFSDFSKDLERAIAYKMDFTRDRQERAIYAFTLVTIILVVVLGGCYTSDGSRHCPRTLVHGRVRKPGSMVIWASRKGDLRRADSHITNSRTGILGGSSNHAASCPTGRVFIATI